MMRSTLFVMVAALLVSCGSEPKPAASTPEAAPKAVRKPTDESRRFRKTNLVDTTVIDKELLGHPFMPGGTLAKYKKGNVEWEEFIAKFPNATDAAVLMSDWKGALRDAKFVASFGGYFGQDNGRPVFVFSKGVWIAGIAGLTEKDAEAEARTLASMLD